MINRKYAAILGVFGNPSDRFMSRGYKTTWPSVLDQLEMAGKQAFVRAVEITTGLGEDFNEQNCGEIMQAVRDNGLEVCALNPNLWGEQRWFKGTIGSADTQTRRQAIDHIKRAIDLAAEVGVPSVGLWPGQDGYDYVFEVDYRKQFDLWVAGMQECADHNPNIKLSLEYKPFEPRTHSTIDTGPKTLLMLTEIERSNVGMTLDVGHALVNHENLADIVALAQRNRKLFHLHLNDNYSDWDWDMNFASVRLFEFIEMIYWLKRTHYDGWYSIDIFAYRTHQGDSVTESLAWLNILIDFIEETGLQKFDELIAQGDPIVTSRFIRQALFERR